ncbi:hypothetical protein WR25_22097 isoform G [Diploscapter pachys]|uniref:Clu domain-containing protein n=1 Tax=Diploscapter pachys TaxID=2018661 RepID=A0A2A2LTG5_9BILA|nr:hypothetical protein WR25_22097 isoform E [Diploscapter pachys]PAV89521.1 hypothetical protein WR25_22097 isoform G [Diploscapter pachys]
MTSGETVAPMTNGKGKGKRGNGKENEHREQQKEHKENGQVAAEMGNETATKTSLDDSGRDTAPNSPDNECLMSAENDSDKKLVATPGVSLATDKVLKLTINPVNAEPFDLQVNTSEMIQELHQVLLEREATCHRTCFSLQLNGQTLDCFTDIRNIPDIVDGSVLQVVEDPYTLRHARVHIRHVRELLRSGNEHIADAANAMDGTSLSYLPSINLNEGKGKEKLSEGQPPDFVLPGTKDRSLAHILPQQSKISPVIRNLSISPYNPPVGPRRLRGDIMYAIVDTVEKRRFHITCCTKGWFVNSSTDEQFDASPSNQYRGIHHELVDLLQTISPGFKKGYSALLTRRANRPMLDRLPTAYPVYSWLTPGQTEIKEDYFRAEDSTQTHRVGFEDHLPGQVRDWNEELQVTHDMARQSLSERLVRDRSIYKIHGDFINAAIKARLLFFSTIAKLQKCYHFKNCKSVERKRKGAMTVADQNVMAINPADEPKTHMYIWNSIFYSLGFDVKDHYKEFGGDAAAFVATSTDLQGVKAYSALDDSKLCTLGMAVVDYRGYRVTAQSIIPGILDREQEQSVIYGSVDFGKTVVSSEKYHQVLADAAKELRILPHDVLTTGENEEDKVVKLYSSYETKEAEVSEEAKKLGFPRKHPHKLAALRQELVELFYDSRYMTFIKTAATHVKEKGQSLPAEEQNTLENEMARIFVELSEGHEIDSKFPLIKEALTKAAEAVHSLCSDTLDIRFNPDCYSTVLRHAPTEDLHAQRRLVMEASDFILTSQLPDLVSACVDGTTNVVDGEMLAEQMHIRGINIRYLGEVLKKTMQQPQSYLKCLVAGELVARCVKHVFRQYLLTVPQNQLAAAMLHLLNCLFGNVDQPASHSSSETKTGKKSNKKAATGLGGKKLTAEWASITTKNLWKSICDEALHYYGYELKAGFEFNPAYPERKIIQVETMDALCEQYGIQRVSLLRRLCRVLGIQLLAKDYHLDFGRQQSRMPFSEEDIQNVFPLFKHRHPPASDAKKLYARGQQAMQMGHLREAYEFVAEAVNLMTSVYGAMHSELAQAMRLLAKLSYILGDLPEVRYFALIKNTTCTYTCIGLNQNCQPDILKYYFFFLSILIMLKKETGSCICII